MILDCQEATRQMLEEMIAKGIKQVFAAVSNQSYT